MSDWVHRKDRAGAGVSCAEYIVRVRKELQRVDLRVAVGIVEDGKKQLCAGHQRRGKPRSTPGTGFWAGRGFVDGQDGVGREEEMRPLAYHSDFAGYLLRGLAPPRVRSNNSTGPLEIETVGPEKKEKARKYCFG